MTRSYHFTFLTFWSKWAYFKAICAHQYVKFTGKIQLHDRTKRKRTMHIQNIQTSQAFIIEREGKNEPEKNNFIVKLPFLTSNISPANGNRIWVSTCRVEVLVLGCWQELRAELASQREQLRKTSESAEKERRERQQAQTAANEAEQTTLTLRHEVDKVQHQTKKVLEGESIKLQELQKWERYFAGFFNIWNTI